MTAPGRWLDLQEAAELLHGLDDVIRVRVALAQQLRQQTGGAAARVSVGQGSGDDGTQRRTD